MRGAAVKSTAGKTAATLALLAFLPGAASAAELGRYATRLDVNGDGSGRSVTTVLAAGAPSETFEVPLVHGGWANFRVTEAPDGLQVAPPKPKAETVRVTLPAAVANGAVPVRFAFAFDVPAALAKAEDPSNGGRLTMPKESRTFRYSFVNTQAAPITDFSVLVTLPEGSRFQAIREQLPKPKKSEVEPRVRLGGEGGRQTAHLQMAKLEQGDDTSMQLEVVPSRRSLLWLAAGVVLSALYLVRFRDLVARKGA